MKSTVPTGLRIIHNTKQYAHHTDRYGNIISVPLGLAPMKIIGNSKRIKALRK